MIAVQPLLFLRECITTPYAEGMHRIKRAWMGIDYHSIYHARLSLWKRAISLITGALLLIPVVNLVIWVAWRIIGHPEQLSNRYFFSEKAPPKPLFTIPKIIVDQKERPHRVENLTYKEGDLGEANWRIKHYKNQILATKKSQQEEVEAVFTPDWRLQTYKNTLLSLPGTMIEGALNKNHLTIQGTDQGVFFKKEYPLKEERPWIQQPTLGFRKFVLSQEEKLHFYSINPKNYGLIKFGLIELVAEKLGTENGLLKVQAYLPGTSWMGWTILWFDPHTGLAKKIENFRAFALFAKTVTLVRSDP